MDDSPSNNIILLPSDILGFFIDRVVYSIYDEDRCTPGVNTWSIIETCNVFKSSKQLALFRPAAGNNWHCSYLHQRKCRASVLTS